MCICMYAYFHWGSFIGLVGRVLTNGPGDQGSVQGHVIPKTERKKKKKKKKKKRYFIHPCLILSIIRYISRVKLNNPGKGVVPSPTPQCSSS